MHDRLERWKKEKVSLLKTLMFFAISLLPGDDPIAVLDIEGTITLIPILTSEELEMSKITPLSVMEKIYDESRKEELELEK